MDLTFPDLMVDVETTGTQPNRNAMIQLAAVKFNLKTRDVSPVIFNRCLRIPKWRTWDEDTRAWWKKQPAVLDSIVAKGEKPDVVMRDFVDFVQKDKGYDPVKFWAKPSTFDYPFVTSYLTDFNEPIPFSFRETEDMNSFLRGIYFPNPIDRTDEPELKGVAHDAIYDVLHQIKVLFHHVDRMKGMDVEFQDITQS